MEYDCLIICVKKKDLKAHNLDMVEIILTVSSF